METRGAQLTLITPFKIQQIDPKQNLGEYKYYDMDQVIAAALEKVKEII